MNTSKRKAIIIGAGPAGLTTAYELLMRTDIIPIVIEQSGDIGGISKTINYKGNRMDIGGHRFFSKSDRVMNWWLDIMPLDPTVKDSFKIHYQNNDRLIPKDATKVVKEQENMMLVRNRLSRIYFLRQFFSYPITLSFETLWKLGQVRTFSILYSYLIARIFPRKQEKSLEDFMINRFGKTLYRLFFRDYTEKVWGVPCNEIPAEWGAQRIKGVSIRKAIEHAIRESVKKKRKQQTDISQKGTETSLIEQFLYPKYGPGQLWEEVANRIKGMGGIIYMHHKVKQINVGSNSITSLTAINKENGEEISLQGDYYFSTMPVKELIEGMIGQVPSSVRTIAAGLQYRDFITVGILLRKMSFLDKRTGEWKPLQLEDTWIYIQEKEVTVGRLQIFNNWSPYMVKDPDTVWVGMEFFCNEGDVFWRKSDTKITELAIDELQKIGLASSGNVLDSTVLRVEKTYPAYFGTYSQFDEIRKYTDTISNLFLIGRNGMHKYNNADHSMLTAMVAVDNIEAGITSKDNIWEINTEQEYHEEKNIIKAPRVVPNSFKEFLFTWQPNRGYLWLAGIAIFIQFVVFKYMYPFASFINGDSYVYLESAYFNLNINTYPVGYSKFLRIFSTFTHSDTVLVLFQYLLLQTSALYLFFSISYFYRPSRIVEIILFIFFVGNPIALYLSNYISSDALFLSLSLFWFTLLIWIIKQPTPKLISFQALLILLAFTVRYNALFYPIIATLAFIISKQSIRVKFIGIASSFLVIAGFIYHTSNQYSKLTGFRQFSPFSGWQIANNALYAYRYVKNKSHNNLPLRFRQLDDVVKSYFNNSDNKKNPWEEVKANTWYMWDPNSPLRQYMQQQFKADSGASLLKRWATVAPLYADYGAYLIKQYPKEYITYFLAPNAIKYYTPPVEFLSAYNTGEDSVAPIAEYWFGYSSRKVNTIFKDFKVSALDFYPVASGVFNILFILGMICFIMLDGLRKRSDFFPILLLVSGLWFVNFVFSVFAASIALRFQLFPIFITFSFDLILLEFIINSARTPDNVSPLIHP